MYRELMPLLLCVSTILSAPQQNSNITYVKRHAKLDGPNTDFNSSEKQFKIENVPLTIPGNVEKKDEGLKNNDKETKEKESTNKDTESIKTTQAPENQRTYNYSDRIYSIKTKPKNNTSTTEKNIPANEEVDNESEINTPDIIPLEIKDTDIIPAESINKDTVANENSGLNYEDVTESDELVTEKYEEEPTVTTEVFEETTKEPAPKPLPKLSYFEKSTYGSFSQNLIAHPGKRRFRSRCRCEKIWNCVKLQISVPRCPEEYFLCCS